MRSKPIVLFLAVLALAGIIAGTLSRPQPPKPELVAARKPLTPPVIAPPKVESPPPVILAPPQAVSSAPPPVAPAPKPAPARPSQLAGSQISTGPMPKTGGPGKPDAQDPVARVALAYVGVDPNAEAYWWGAINNPSLPPQERQDLIEDLNEDGLSDPKHPGPQDLPVIMRRLSMLDEMEAMDQVNADAMNEAYKDLVNLAQIASATGGAPVQ